MRLTRRRALGAMAGAAAAGTAMVRHAVSGQEGGTGTGSAIEGKERPRSWPAIDDPGEEATSFYAPASVARYLPSVGVRAPMLYYGAAASTWFPLRVGLDEERRLWRTPPVRDARGRFAKKQRG